jgi:P27 family predicted phage terminase small subunit
MADAVESPECPSWLKGESRREWFRVVPILLARKTLGQADFGHLAGMCDWWGQYVMARLRVRKLGSKSYKGHLMDHPRVVMNTAWKEYSKAAQQFGLSPASKARVSASDGSGKEPAGKGRFFAGPKLAVG